MPYAPFYEYFPDLAVKETRTLTVFNVPDLPPGEYGFLEAYCDERGCDCRRVFFNVIEARTQQVCAVLAYGWESREFYVKWFKMDIPAVIRELQGPALNSASQQSVLAPALLKQLRVLLQDPAYVERLKRHYALFKAAIDRGAGAAPPGLEPSDAPGAHPKRRRRRR